MQNRRLTFCLILCLVALAARAQEPDHDHQHDQQEAPVVIGHGHTHPDDPTMGGYQGVERTPMAGSVDNVAQPENHADTTRRVRERRPMESYFFDDSVRAMRNFLWVPSLERNTIRIGSVDTALHDFRSDLPFLKGRGDVGAVYLGNLGAAAMPLDFAARSQGRDFSFARVWEDYFLTPLNAPFYNVKQPFTQLSYYTAGQKKYAEDQFRATHAQNITPSTGFSLDYRSLGTQGIYAHQRARQRNLSTNLNHVGKKYTLHIGYNWNRVETQENGGVEDDFWVTDTLLELTENIPVRLKDARTWVTDNTFYLVQSYGVPLRKLSEGDFSIADQTSFYIGQSTRWSKYKKYYTDTKAASGEFYADWIGDPATTYDSLGETLLSNRVFIQIQPWGRQAAVGLLDAGVGMDVHQYHNVRREVASGEEPEQPWSLVGRTAREEDYYIYGAASGALSRYLSWGGQLRLSPAGDRSGDVEMGAHLTLNAYWKGRPITLSGRINSSQLAPSYWDRRYISNHFEWENDFTREKRTRLDVDLRIPHLGIEAGLTQQLLTDHIHYDSLALPAQASGTVSVTGLRASSLIRLGILRLDHRVVVQWSSDQQIVPLPTLSAYAAWYLEFNVVRDVLRVQIGADGRYNTKYYAPGYMPATAQFYNQRAVKTGGYPLVDAFVAAKWKRMRILLQLEHANDDLFGGRRYFSAAHYPLNKRVFKMGISWGFYD